MEMNEMISQNDTGSFSPPPPLPRHMPKRIIYTEIVEMKAFLFVLKSFLRLDSSSEFVKEYVTVRIKPSFLVVSPLENTSLRHTAL